jgi:hypothetical protein
MGIRNNRKELQGMRQSIERERNLIKKRKMVLEYEGLMDIMEA